MLSANRSGQQLFLADLFRRNQQSARPGTPGPQPVCRGLTTSFPVTYRQLTLFDLSRDLVRGHQLGFPDPPDAGLAQLLDDTATSHARSHGWSLTRILDARKGIRLLLAIQDTPGAAIKASDVTDLAQLSLALQPVLDILAAAQMLDDDREPSIVAWFARQIEGLPEPMTHELHTWFEVLRLGSTTASRSRPRTEGTVRGHIHQAMPAVREWAAAGHESLREISREHIKQALPETGTSRSLVGQSLRSLFKVLKSRRMVFSNPITHFRTGRPETRIPLPIDVRQLKDALTSQNPARAVLAALIAFHALRNNQLRSLLLTDIRDGRLHLPDRTILLAPPVRERLTAWLDHRERRWPATANPHLILNKKTAVRSSAVSHTWINTTLGMTSQSIREDRILHEAIATDGDVRRLCDLFGLSVQGAERYTDVLNHQALRSDGDGDAADRPYPGFRDW
ncbi:hypothetical protein ACFYV7_39315 [Nocardia suismassiliense]|uniref:Integrase n=1 Tax=Nocardia suismassiliense TaxID=2077092 RepID=A0ABW6R5U7_9NOCA